MKTDNKFESLWLGDMTTFMAADAALKKLAELSVTEMAGYRADDGQQDGPDFGDYGYMVSEANGVAVVTIAGPMVSDESMWNQYMGVVSYEEIRNAAIAAVQCPDVHSILLSINSGGGTSVGVQECSAFLAEVDAKHKPVYTHTGGSMASAAYWVGSAGRDVSSSPMARVGSIGVIAVHKEYTKMLEMAGIRATVFRAGKFKALGSPYEKMSAEAVKLLEETMAQLYDFFIAGVALNRDLPDTYIRANAAEGLEFWGQDAVSVGLADAVRSFDQAIEHIVALHAASASSGTSQSLNFNRGDTSMATKKQVLTAQAHAALAAGAPAAEALALGTQVTGDEPTPSVEVVADADAGIGAGSGDAPAVEAAPVAVALSATVSDNSTAVLVDKLMGVQTELAAVKAELAQLQSSTEQMKTANAGLSEAVRASIQKMQIGMNQAPTSMGTFEGTVLVAEFHRTEAAFNARYKIGATAQLEVDDKTDTPAQSQQHQTRVRASRISTVEK